MLAQRCLLSGIPVQGKHKVPGVLKLSRSGKRRLVHQFKSRLEGVMQRSLEDYVGWEDEERKGEK